MISSQNMSRTDAGKSVIVEITEEYHISQARQKALALAEETGFNRVAVFYLGTSVMELANNLFFHARRGGTITLIPVRRNGDFGIEIIAEDEGPGIPDLKLALQDGFSTNGGLGGGLPGIKRLMDEFEISSSPGSGTRIVARKWQTCRLE